MDDAWAEYWSALHRGDRHAALAVVRRLHDAGADPVKIIDGLVMPAQERIGELWLEGEWSIAEEHAATVINEGLVHWLCSFAEPPASDAPLVVVSCLERERHALPALVVAETLMIAGYRVNYVGSDPEPGDLLRRILTLKPRAVLFSASLTSSLAGQKSLLGSIRAIGIPVVVGGRAFGGDDRRALALGATAYARGIDDVLRLMADLPPGREPGQSMSLGPADEEAAWVLEYAGEIAPYVLRAIAHRHEHDLEWPPWWTRVREPHGPRRGLPRSGAGDRRRDDHGRGPRLDDAGAGPPRRGRRAGRRDLGAAGRAPARPAARAALPRRIGRSSWSGRGPLRASERLDQQGDPVPARPGEHERRLGVAGQGQPLAELVGHHVDAALLDRQPADAALAQCCAQCLLPVREARRGPGSRGANGVRNDESEVT